MTTLDRQTPDEVARHRDDVIKLLVEKVKEYALFVLDPEGYVVTWNVGAERIKGYAADEIIGRHFSVFYPPEAIDRGTPQAALEAAARDGSFETDGWRVRKDGSRFFASLVLTALRDDDGNLRGFAKITRDLTERRTIEAFRESERRVDEFLAVLSHELRNPIAAIQNAAGIVRKAASVDPAMSLAGGILDRQLANLAHLVDDLLDIARIRSGNYELDLAPTNAVAVLHGAAEAARPLFDARDQQLQILLPAESPFIDGDVTRLSQAVGNLLSNAAKYTPDGGRITLALDSDATHASIRVADTGTGISSAMLGQVFGMFTQGKRTLDRSEGGLGIGLAVVNRIVELHRGTVEAVSEGPGQGTEFVMRIPLAASPHQARPAESAREGGAKSEDAPSLRILVVDDNRDSADGLAMLLEVEGHDTAAVYEATRAATVVDEQRPQLVLLDIGMPELDGYEVARRIRTTCRHQPVLIAVSGYGSDADQHLSRQAGFDAHYVKPVDLKTLKGLIGSRDWSVAPGTSAVTD